MIRTETWQQSLISFACWLALVVAGVGSWLVLGELIINVFDLLMGAK